MSEKVRNMTADGTVLDGDLFYKVGSGGGDQKITGAQMREQLSTSSLSQNPVENEYTTTAQMITDQGAQTTGFFQFVSTGDQYYEKLSTNSSSINDYRLLTASETTSLLFSDSWKQFTVEAVSPDSSPINEVTRQQIALEYDTASDLINSIIVNANYADAMANIFAERGDYTYKLQVYNGKTSKLFVFDVSDIQVLNTDYYKIIVTETYPRTEFGVGIPLTLNWDLDAEGSGGSGFTQVAYSTALTFATNQISSFGSVTDNSHTQSGAITFTYDFTNAVEGSTRIIEIVSDGNTWTLPTSQNNTRSINLNSTTVIAKNDNVITPESGKRYQLNFDYSNGQVYCYVIDVNVFTNDITPPTFTVAPNATSIIETGFTLNAQTNENTTIYTVVVPDGDTAPNASEVIAGTASGGGAALSSGNANDTGSGVNIVLSGLTASTAYDCYTVAVDGASNESSVVLVDVTTAATPPTLLYSSHPFEIGYATFQLRSTITTPLRIRRSSDNAETDVDFDGTEITLSSTVSAGGDLTTWVGSDDAFVVTWYNQGSQASQDLTNATTTEQPQIISSGALLTRSGRVTVEFDGTDDYLLSSTSLAWLGGSGLSTFHGVTFDDVSIEAMLNAFGSGSLFFARVNLTNKLEYRYVRFDNSTQDNYETTASLSTATTYQLATTDNFSTEIELYIDGVEESIAAISSSRRTTTSGSLALGAFNNGGSNFLNGGISYAILYTSNESTNVSAIETILA